MRPSPIALILTILIIHDDDHAAGPHILQDLFGGVQFHRVRIMPQPVAIEARRGALMRQPAALFGRFGCSP